MTGVPFIFKSRVYDLQPFSSDFRYCPEETDAWRSATPCLIRFGDLPDGDRSFIGPSGRRECGVSVFVGRRMGSKVMAVLPNLRGPTFVDFFHLWFADRPVYIIRGRVYQSQGSIGEPLLRSARLIERVRYAKAAS